MKPLFVHYPKCGTCRKAAKWLAQHGVDVEARDIVADRPTAGELARWQAASGRPVQKFFNTSGLLYKELGLKDKLPALSHGALVVLLASHGKLVKRPVLVLPDRVLVGFREEEWSETLAR